MNASRPAMTRGLIGMVAALLAMLVAASSASAVTGHQLSRSFGTTAPNKIAGVGDVVARPAPYNDVFVVDTGASNPEIVRHYSQAGDALSSIDLTNYVARPSALAADPSNGDIYVGGFDPTFDHSVAVRFDPTGATPPATIDLRQAPGGFGSVTGLAVDSQHRLFAGSTFPAVVDRFDSDGTPSGTISGVDANSPFSSVGPIAVDSTDAVYVTDVGIAVRRFNANTFTFSRTIGSDKPLGVAVDRAAASNRVYVQDSPDGVRYGITRYTSTGTREERFGEVAYQDPFGNPNNGPYSALSVDSAAQTVFAGDRTNSAVAVFTTFTAPDASTNAPPANPGGKAVDVSGKVNRNNQAGTTYSFEYGADSSYGSTTTGGDVTGNGSVTVTDQLTGLTPLTTYHYRLKATNANGSNYGQDRTVTTSSAPPDVSGESASATAFTANLSASVNSNNTETKAHFEYRPQGGGAYTSTPNQTVSAGTTAQSVSATIQNLDPEVTYEYRVVADAGTAGTTTGDTFTFTTKPAPPLASPGAVTGVSGDSAQFTGSVDTQGLAATVSFVVTAKNSPYQAVTTPQNVPAGSSDAQPVSGSISGLPAGGVFEVRVRVQTSTSTTLSDPIGFSTASLATAPPPAPALVTPLPQGCVTPRLAAPAKTLSAGKSATLTGSGLGSSGSVSFGSSLGRVTRYSDSSVTVVVPSKASGKVAVRVTCGNVSNTVTANVKGAAPSNRFSTSSSVKGSKATVKVKVPGRGSVSVSGKGIGSKKASPKKAGTVSVKVALSKSGRKALAKAKSKRLSVKVSVRYRPSGGSTRSATRTLVFRR